MPLFITYFSSTQVNLLFAGFIALIFSTYFHVKEKEILCVVFLIIAATLIFCFSASLDPFLNLWDERYHALVGKNLMNHMLTPTLYDDPVVDTDYSNWGESHIWLHKQPLFLWQIALSFKLFGISEFSLRLPSIILGVIVVLICYRCGKLLVSKRVGFIASILFMSNIYITELISGRQMSDHNDLAFLAYVSLTIWSFIEYYYSKNKFWIYLTGIFAGMAILTKWLVGLLVYFGWLVLRLQQRKFKFSANKDLILSVLVALLISVPWQIFTFITYPEIAKKEFEFNAMHFSTAVEGHQGPFWYHFNIFNSIYGSIASFLIIPALYFLYKKIRDKNLYFSLLSMVLIVYLFFSLAATKMPSFTTIIAVIIFIAFAALCDMIIENISKRISLKWIKNIIWVISILIIPCFMYNVELLQENHTTWKKNNLYTVGLIHNKNVFLSLELPENSVLFNSKGHFIEAMFYTGFPAYSIIPSKKLYIDMKKKKRTVAIFIDKNTILPDYLDQDTSVIKIEQEILFN